MYIYIFKCIQMYMHTFYTHIYALILVSIIVNHITSHTTCVKSQSFLNSSNRSEYRNWQLNENFSFLSAHHARINWAMYFSEWSWLTCFKQSFQKIRDEALLLNERHVTGQFKFEPNFVICCFDAAVFLVEKYSRASKYPKENPVYEFY